MYLSNLEIMYIISPKKGKPHSLNSTYSSYQNYKMASVYALLFCAKSNIDMFMELHFLTN